MYSFLLHAHSGIRSLLLLLLVVVIVKATIGLATRAKFTSLDNRLSLWLLITTHIQLLLGFVLYFVSPNVQFSAAAMHDKYLRYWTAEHLVGMIGAIALITIARVMLRRLPLDSQKFAVLCGMNTAALVIIILMISLSGRMIFGG